jgi:hypothetical protein
MLRDTGLPLSKFSRANYSSETPMIPKWYYRETKSNYPMATSRTITLRKKEVQDSIKDFLKDGPKTFEQILDFRKAQIKDTGRRGTEQYRIDLANHLLEMASTGAISVEKIDGIKQYSTTTK